VARGHLLELSGDASGARRAWNHALELPMSAHERTSLIEHRDKLEDAAIDDAASS
jgi:predicted RNA polymerase sigma factor